MEKFSVVVSQWIGLLKIIGEQHLEKAGIAYDIISGAVDIDEM